MEMIMENEKIRNTREYRSARKQARELRGFYIHLVCYCTIIPMLICINVIFVPDFYWFPFSMFGWGTGLLFHWMAVKKFTPFLGRGWEEKKMKQFMEQEEARRQKLTKESNDKH
jgi:hypothetical protein